MTAPESWDPKIVSYGDVINPDWSKELRPIFEIRHWGHFTVEEGDSPWTQAEIDAEWARQKAPTNVTQPSHLSLILISRLSLSRSIMLFPTRK